MNYPFHSVVLSCIVVAYILNIVFHCFYIPYYSLQCSGCESYGNMIRKCVQLPRRCFYTYKDCVPLCRERC